MPLPKKEDNLVEQSKTTGREGDKILFLSKKTGRRGKGN